MTLRSTLPLLLLWLAPAQLPAQEIGSIEFLGQATLKAGTEFEDTQVGGLSGITFDSELDRYYAISDDPNLRSPSRFYTLRIDLGDGELNDDRLEIESVTALRDRRDRPFAERVIDGEGIALTPARTLLISSEGNVKRGIPPSIREVDLNGKEIREIRIPKIWKPRSRRSGESLGVRHNMAIEALTVVPRGSAFYVGSENALHQDGPETDIGQGSRARIVHYDLAKGKPGTHYVYEVEPVVLAPPLADAFRTNGLVDLLALDAHRLISLERSYTAGVGNSIRLFLISTHGADDVSKVKSLEQRTDLKPVSKRLLLDLSELGLTLDNVEGLTLGPELPDGRSSLILISDDNFTAPQFTQVLAFAIDSQHATPPGVQGRAHRSPLEGRWVFGVKGVVTATDLEGRRHGFWIQDPDGDDDPSTSDALFVSTGEPSPLPVPPLQAGDLVSVTGRVAEIGRSGSLSVTRLDAREIEIEGRLVELPVAVRVLGTGDGRTVPGTLDDDGLARFEPESDALDFWESLEGMRVEIDQPRVVGPSTRFGTFSAAPGGQRTSLATSRGGLLLTENGFNPERVVVDGSLLEDTPAVNVGQLIEPPLVGVLDYAFNNYRVVATEEISTSENARADRGRSSLATGQHQLTVASYNVENLDAGDDQEKFDRVARSVVDGLGAPDLLALQEIQDDTGTLDDGTVSAVLTLGKLVEAIRAAGGPAYEFAQIDPANNADGGAPGGNIRVGFLFKPDRLQLARDPGPLLPANPARLSIDSKAFQADAETGYQPTRKPLAAEFLFGERRLLVVNVHLKSKRGDDAIFGSRQPPACATERQRLEQTSELGSKLAAVLASDPEALIVLLGDFNDHEFREPVLVLEGFGLRNLIGLVPTAERYSYNYEGNSQMLDHILVSPALSRADISVEIVHLNADFPASERASDHDPVLVGFGFEVP